MNNDTNKNTISNGYIVTTEENSWGVVNINNTPIEVWYHRIQVKDIIRLMKNNVHPKQHHIIISQQTNFKETVLFKGEVQDVPNNLLNSEISSIGLDINEEREPDWTNVIGITIVKEK